MREKPVRRDIFRCSAGCRHSANVSCRHHSGAIRGLILIAPTRLHRNFGHFRASLLDTATNSSPGIYSQTCSQTPQLRFRKLHALLLPCNIDTPLKLTARKSLFFYCICKLHRRQTAEQMNVHKKNAEQSTQTQNREKRAVYRKYNNKYLRVHCCAICHHRTPVLRRTYTSGGRRLPATAMSARYRPAFQRQPCGPETSA